MKKFIRNLLIILYVIIAIFVTVCLISYNDHKVTQFGDTSLVIVDNKDFEPNFNKNDLVIVNSDENIGTGKEIFFYNVYENKYTISIAKVTNTEKISDSETTYTLESGQVLSSDNVIGKTENAKKISNVGAILKVLESKWGYLFLIVLPSLLAFLYELVEVIKDVRSSKK